LLHLPIEKFNKISITSFNNCFFIEALKRVDELAFVARIFSLLTIKKTSSASPEIKREKVERADIKEEEEVKEDETIQSIKEKNCSLTSMPFCCAEQLLMFKEPLIKSF
jgi:hypothetical protein